MISPRYAVILGAACGFFLVGTLLAVAVLIGDMGGDSSKPVAAPRKTVAASDTAKVTQQIEKLDGAIADLESRLAKMSDELAAAKAQAGAAPAAKDDKTEKGADAASVAPAQPDYSGGTGAPELSRADPALAGALAALNLDSGHDEEWKDAVKEVYREMRRDEMRDGRNMRTERHVAWMDKYLHLTEEQKNVLRDIRRRESEQMAELYSRENAENTREIRAESIRLQCASAEEFKRALNSDQASHIGMTLNGLR